MTLLELVVLAMCLLLAIVIIVVAVILSAWITLRKSPFLQSISSSVVPAVRNKSKKPLLNAYTDADERNRQREAYYMANFWSYDGSEQEEWQE